MKNLVVGIAFLFAANVAFAQGLAQDVDALQLENEELKAVISELVALQRCHAMMQDRDWETIPTIKFFI